MVVALQKLPNPYFGGMLNSYALVSFKGSATFNADPEVVFFPFFAGGGGVKNYCCLSSKLCMQPSHCLASVWIRQKCLCGPDRPETRGWVDGHWLLWVFHLQEVKRYTHFNKAANQSHVQQQAAKQLVDCRAGRSAVVDEQPPVRKEWHIHRQLQLKQDPFLFQAGLQDFLFVASRVQWHGAFLYLLEWTATEVPDLNWHCEDNWVHRCSNTSDEVTDIDM